MTGEYQCLVRNKIGALLSGVAKLRVACKFTSRSLLLGSVSIRGKQKIVSVAAMDRNFTKNPVNLSVPESLPGVLQCNIHSVPPAEIQWEFNNQPLPQHTRYAE